MAYSRIRKENKIWIFTFILVVAVLGNIILSYYRKTLDHKDRLTAKRLEKSIATVLAKNVGSDLTYDSGRICWSEKNSIIIKSGIAKTLTEGVVPRPDVKGHYYYMYLESPYTVIKLPYKTKGNPNIDLEVVTEEYMKKTYPIKEYVQVDEKIPELFTGYESSRVKNLAKNIIVCLNQ